MPSPATEEHQDEVMFIADILNGFRYARGTGIVRLGPGVLAVAPGRNLAPDIFVLPPGDPPAAGEPPARLVVEVLSRSTRTHDLVRKASIYREAAIPEVLYVDLEQKRLGAFARAGRKYRLDWH